LWSDWLPRLTLPSMSNDLIVAGARNLADWHDACLSSLGIRTRRSKSMWRCEADAPFIYLTAITLSPDPIEQRAELESIASTRSGPISVCDCWSRIDLSDLGFERFESEAWYVRQPDGVSIVPTEVERVSEPESLAEFESATHDGFEASELHELGRFGVYGKAVLDNQDMRVFVRREGGRVVSGSMGYISAGVVGVYAVATVPAFRRKGYGEQVTWAAARSEPSSPAILQPSHQALPMYRRMGFAPVGAYTKWLRLP
jgi:GNAT superfamily N-acetyltransferase